VAKDVDIGELASLTETNNVIDNNNITLTAEVRKTWSQKYILKYLFYVTYFEIALISLNYLDLTTTALDLCAFMQQNLCY